MFSATDLHLAGAAGSCVSDEAPGGGEFPQLHKRVLPAREHVLKPRTDVRSSGLPSVTQLIILIMAIPLTGLIRYVRMRVFMVISGRS